MQSNIRHLNSVFLHSQSSVVFLALKRALNSFPFCQSASSDVPSREMRSDDLECWKYQRPQQQQKKNCGSDFLQFLPQADSCRQHEPLQWFKLGGRRVGTSKQVHRHVVRGDDFHEYCWHRAKIDWVNFTETYLCTCGTCFSADILTHMFHWKEIGQADLDVTHVFCTLQKNLISSPLCVRVFVCSDERERLSLCAHVDIIIIPEPQ